MNPGGADPKSQICRRCLLQDMPGDYADYYRSIVRYRQNLSPQQGVDDDTYQKRLDSCLACDELVNGVCGQCGCYVEMRAAARKMRCPKPGGGLW